MRLRVDRTLFPYVAYDDVAGEAGEEPAGEGADEDADNDVAEVVFADEDAADRYHEGPEEHPPAVCLEPLGHGGRGSAEASFHAHESAEG